MSVVDELKKKLLGKDEKNARPKKRRLSTGQTLLNLALTGDPSWGLEEGCYYLFVGDSGAGKTFEAFECLAQAANNPAFDDYRLIYDAPERGARMSIRKFFGRKLEERIEWRYSEKVEEMYYELASCFADGRPFLYVEDSETALDTDADESKFMDQKAAHEKGKTTTGSFGTAKPKIHSALLRSVPSKLAKTGSILILLSQTRDNLGFGATFNPKTRAGGRAMKFYATDEIWFSIYKRITKTVNGTPRKIGTELEVTVKKNRDTGYEPVVPLIHYPSVGLSDLDACVQFLVDEKRWKSAKEDGTGKIAAADFDFTGSREQVVRFIEENNKEKELRRLVKEVWDEVMAQCAVQRKPRYK